MKPSRPFSTCLGLILGACAALLLNVAVARASDDDAVVMEEFHQTYPLNANGRVELQNINGAVHITAWDPSGPIATPTIVPSGAIPSAYESM